jgi:hypothetical protein
LLADLVDHILLFFKSYLKNKLFGYEGKPFEELFKRLKKKKKKPS